MRSSTNDNDLNRCMLADKSQRPDIVNPSPNLFKIGTTNNERLETANLYSGFADMQNDRKRYSISI